MAMIRKDPSVSRQFGVVEKGPRYRIIGLVEFINFGRSVKVIAQIQGFGFIDSQLGSSGGMLLPYTSLRKQHFAERAFENGPEHTTQVDV
jgi:hypothetical protein